MSERLRESLLFDENNEFIKCDENFRVLLLHCLGRLVTGVKFKNKTMDQLYEAFAAINRSSVVNIKELQEALMLRYPKATKFKKKKVKLKRPQKLKSNNDFYSSWEWRTLRMKVIKRDGNRCHCCGSSPDDVDIGGKPVRIVVDHIKPIRKYWDLRLDINNLQILCDECNMGKGSWDKTKWKKF